jgi:hypothetical protein
MRSRMRTVTGILRYLSFTVFRFIDADLCQLRSKPVPAFAAN